MWKALKSRYRVAASNRAGALATASTESSLCPLAYFKKARYLRLFRSLSALCIAMV